MAAKIKFNYLNDNDKKDVIFNTFKFVLNNERNHYDLNIQREYELVLHTFETNNPVILSKNKVVYKRLEKEFIKFIDFHL